MGKEKPKEYKLKTCSKDPTHQWMADIPFCPYCNVSQEARIYYAEQERKRSRDEGRK